MMDKVSRAARDKLWLIGALEYSFKSLQIEAWSPIYKRPLSQSEPNWNLGPFHTSGLIFSKLCWMPVGGKERSSANWRTLIPSSPATNKGASFLLKYSSFLSIKSSFGPLDFLPSFPWDRYLRNSPLARGLTPGFWLTLGLPKRGWWPLGDSGLP